MDITITKGQKKILIAVSIAIGVLLIFHILIYQPAKNSMRSLKSELDQIEARIDATKTIIGRDKPLAEGFSILQKRFEEVDKKFPENEEETLQIISSLAYKSGVNISSIKPRPVRKYLDKNGSAVRIGNKTCHQIPLSISGRAAYKKLGSFLESLREEVPNLLTVEKLKVSKESSKYELSVDMDLTMYLLCK
jgi:Tfp pilus assembly protein PilO